MYTSKSAEIYDALYAFLDYDRAATKLREVVDYHDPTAKRLLEVACGTGQHLRRLSSWYDVEGLDINEDLLKVASERCPGVKLHQSDMADFDLGDSFDVVCCLFSSIAYVVTRDRLRSTIESMKRHLAPGGLMVVEPWFGPDNFWTGTITMNVVDEPERKIAWMYTSEAVDLKGVLDIHYLMGTPEGVEHFSEVHELGLFSDEDYRSALEAVGLDVEHRDDGLLVGRGLYIGRDRGR